MEQRYTWQDWEHADLTNEAWARFLDDGLLAHGSQSCPEYRATWSLDASQGWVTRRLDVQVTSDHWTRSLCLTRSPEGEWTSEVTAAGSAPRGMAEPGIVDTASLGSALDCDLGRCPLTNTMPIRRLGLLDHQQSRTALVMAWVDMPSLQVIASDQYYQSHDSHHVRYVSGTRGVDVLLEVDPDAVVITYPDLARRV